jgi:hypothetical protein
MASPDSPARVQRGVTDLQWFTASLAALAVEAGVNLVAGFLLSRFSALVFRRVSRCKALRTAGLIDGEHIKPTTARITTTTSLALI